MKDGVEQLARTIAYWHGTHAFSRSGGVTESVASRRLGQEPTGFPDVYDRYAKRHWQEYTHVADAVFGRDDEFLAVRPKWLQWLWKAFGPGGRFYRRRTME